MRVTQVKKGWKDEAGPSRFGDWLFCQGWEVRETLKGKEMLRMALAGTWGKVLAPFTMTGDPGAQAVFVQGSYRS